MKESNFHNGEEAQVAVEVQFTKTGDNISLIHIEKLSKRGIKWIHVEKSRRNNYKLYLYSNLFILRFVWLKSIGELYELHTSVLAYLQIIFLKFNCGFLTW